MSDAVIHGPDEGGDEIVAAEYVVGVLPPGERRTVSTRIDSDASFARIVDRWEGYFAPLAAAYAPVEAPASVKVAVDRRLFSGQALSAPATAADRPGLWASLAFWRGLTVAALAALALYVAIPVLSPPAVEDNRFVAAIEPANSDVRYLAVYDAGTGEVALSHVAGERGAGRDFELWMLEDANATPVSMGVIPAGSSARLPVPRAIREKLGPGMLLAVSREPLGGSPNGSPTEVVALGGLSVI